MNDRTLTVTGLDGSTPLGYLAALGLLTVVSDAPGAHEQPRLSWRFENRWNPVLNGIVTFDELSRIVYDDALRWARSPLLCFRYPKLEKKGIKLVGALSAPIAVLRQWLKEELRRQDYEVLAYAAALTYELASEPADPKKVLNANVLLANGLPFDATAALDRVTKPTFFDFTSRNAHFLEQVEEVRSQLTLEGIRLELEVSAANPEGSRTLDWDVGADAPGALYANHKSAYHTAAEWLAFRGLVFFPVAGGAGELETTACEGRRKAGTFTWALWDQPVDAKVAACIVRYPKLAFVGARERRALGLVQVFRSALTKKADGYSGMFAPSEPI